MQYVSEVHALIDALELQQEVVNRVSLEDLKLVSPCEAWTIREVLSHSIGVTRKFVSFASGVTDEPHAPPGDLVGPDHQTALRDTVSQARTAWASVDMRRTCHLPFGTFPAEIAAGINLFDVLAHTWDIAAATDIELDGDEDLWTAGLVSAQRVIGPARDLLHYGAEVAVSEGAPAMMSFLAFLGRTSTRP